ncbi:MAG TPA: DMT family transporter, partial [Desulfitobacteriaceae bacterium]|nr:DMT family transporter [Desulfitobacteriaceae bacterium]
MKILLNIGNRECQGLKGVTAVLFSATCFAATSILFKIAFRLGLSPEQTLALQSWLSALLLLAYALSRRQWAEYMVDRRTLVILLIQGLAGSLGTSLIFAYSLLYLPVSVAILLLYLYPVLVLAAGVVLWQKQVSGKEIMALVLTLAGTVLASGVLSGVGAVPFKGIILGVTAAVCYAIFNLTGAIALKRVSPLVALSYAHWFSSLGLLLLLRQDALLIPWQSSAIWILGFVLATVASLLPFYLILVGIKYIGSDKAAILSTFELPMTFILAALILYEFPDGRQWAGGGLV